MKVITIINAHEHTPQQNVTNVKNWRTWWPQPPHYCHQKHAVSSVNKGLQCEILHCLVSKRQRFSQNWTSVQCCVVNLWWQEKKCAQLSTHNVMAFRGLACNFLQNKTCYSEVHPCFTSSGEHVWDPFLTLHLDGCAKSQNSVFIHNVSWTKATAVLLNLITDDTDMHNCWSMFFFNVYNLSQISSNFLSVSSCPLHVLLVPRMEPVARNHSI